MDVKLLKIRCFFLTGLQEMDFHVFFFVCKSDWYSINNLKGKNHNPQSILISENVFLSKSQTYIFPPGLPEMECFC